MPSTDTPAGRPRWRPWTKTGNPAWPAHWQRHYAALRELLADEQGQAHVLPGVTVHGMDIGKWLARQRTPKTWHALHDGQRERLEAIGITPPAPEPEEPAKAPKAPVSLPEGHRSPVDLPDVPEIRLGVFLSNTKSRRAKLTPDKLQQLAALGCDWTAA